MKKDYIIHLLGDGYWDAGKKEWRGPLFATSYPNPEEGEKDIEVILYSNPNVIGITLITRYKPE